MLTFGIIYYILYKHCKRAVFTLDIVSAFLILFLLPRTAERLFASVAQSVEQGTENPRVGGSIPPGGTIYADVAHLVERHLAKVEVASSSLVIRSNKAIDSFDCFFYLFQTGYGLSSFFSVILVY